jgi:hypothetical protein
MADNACQFGNARVVFDHHICHPSNRNGHKPLLYLLIRQLQSGLYNHTAMADDQGPSTAYDTYAATDIQVGYILVPPYTLLLSSSIGFAWMNSPSPDAFLPSSHQKN